MDHGLRSRPPQEGVIYATHILANVSDPKIAVPMQNDDFGKDLLSGLKQGLGSNAEKLRARWLPTRSQTPQATARSSSSRAPTAMSSLTSQPQNLRHRPSGRRPSSAGGRRTP